MAELTHLLASSFSTSPYTYPNLHISSPPFLIPPKKPTHNKMARQRRSAPAPARSAPRRPTAAPARPAAPSQQQSQPHSTAAQPPQAQAPPMQQQSAGPGLFGQMASTAA